MYSSILFPHWLNILLQFSTPNEPDNTPLNIFVHELLRIILTSNTNDMVLDAARTTCITSQKTTYEIKTEWIRMEIGGLHCHSMSHLT